MCPFTLPDGKNCIITGVGLSIQSSPHSTALNVPPQKDASAFLTLTPCGTSTLMKQMPLAGVASFISMSDGCSTVPHTPSKTMFEKTASVEWR